MLLLYCCIVVVLLMTNEYCVVRCVCMHRRSKVYLHPMISHIIIHIYNKKKEDNNDDILENNNVKHKNKKKEKRNINDNLLVDG